MLRIGYFTTIRMYVLYEYSYIHTHVTRTSTYILYTILFYKHIVMIHFHLTHSREYCEIQESVCSLHE